MVLAAPRWAISFADIGLLLLGCFVMLHAVERTAEPSRSATVPAPVESVAFRADGLFEPGEARLRAQSVERLQAVGRSAHGRSILLVSSGVGSDNARLDAFELAAARSAAVARALREEEGAGGAIMVRMDSSSPAGSGQKIEIRFSR